MAIVKIICEQCDEEFEDFTLHQKTSNRKKCDKCKRLNQNQASRLYHVMAKKLKEKSND